MDEGKVKSKITIKDLWATFWRWWLSCEMSNSYERMQAVAYCYAMIPTLKKLYPDKDDFKEALKRHLIFFNTEGICGNIILGMTVAMEEEMAACKSIAGEAVVALKSALMGPVAGIGDTITWGTVKPLIFTVALTASAGGSVTGWVLMFLFVPVTVAYGWYLMTLGYKVGKNALVTLLESGWINRIIMGAGILGLFMVGALSASIVTLSLTGTYMSAGVETTYQSIVDGIVPGLLPMLAIMGIYVYIKKRGQSFGKLILVIVAVSMVLSFLGIV